MSEISQFSQGLHEECGVFGMYDKTGATDMVSAVYSALYALQHRGQESCGIALNVDGVLSGHRDLGLVSEVFTKRVLEDLPRGAKMATGHVRYATAGQRSRSNAQPMILHHCKGAMAVCHNGNLVNAPKLRRKLDTFLKYYPVTIVYPIVHTKYLYWIDEETGEISSKRKSPKTGTIYDAVPELYKIKMYLNNFILADLPIINALSRRDFPMITPQRISPKLPVYRWGMPRHCWESCIP